MSSSDSPIPVQLQAFMSDLPNHMSGMMPELTVMGIVNWVAAGAMVFGGVVPFIPQFRDIRRSGNTDGFSTFVCLTLLIANILRIMFWFGKHFELPLLAQSVIMVFTMMMMMRLCVQMKNKSEIVASKQHQFTDSKNHPHQNGDSETSRSYPSLGKAAGRSTFLDFDRHQFWQWTDFKSYIQFIMLFTAMVALLTFLLLNNIIYVELIGFLAVFAEALLGAPQFYRNFQNKSTQGMSKKMVGFWTCGDVFKTGYFILREAPPQFWICGMLQVSIDISIFVQVFLYRNLRARAPKYYSS
ncbi:PQ-loop repeat-containing protein 1-like isoform X1 [Mizuhopecten yessoensis]|uniref:PQ-loop repeat-containing protein 1-like isoform X1 n=1 Tax=Mizuhopecten yessoensis TaxID=6573 RepID=UPI000B45E007|nr:PQ-loop repeat-containing protein 1-like isoform X1 [Mizuhopecten yessoensis]XP_021358284.1 PQ-loop repeat-containing protein 1-like isoform X1 [Mizuhopecten yessoensis]XP_021358285.1 PQ-loop repeat-containing protein 1-like isoform X1 [Mizuhopecten yessoensis]